MEMMNLSTNNKLPKHLFLISKVSIFFTLLVIFVVALFFSYPDTIEVEVELESTTPPIYVQANTDGFIEDILVSENDRVIKDQILAQIRTAVNNSNDKHIIRSPKNGIVLFDSKKISKNPIKSQDSLFTIVSNNKKDGIIAKCFVSSNNLERISQGSKTNIHLEAFSAQKYGLLDSEIAKISTTPIKKDSSDTPLYLTTMYLDLPLITSFKDTIPFETKLSGVAQVFTEKKNFLQRIYIKYIIENGS